MKRIIVSIIVIGLLLTIPLFTVNAVEKLETNTSQISPTNNGTICVDLKGRMLGMPGAKVRCRAIDGVNTYDVTKTVHNSGTPIPYFYVCHYPPYPGEYEISVDPAVPGFRGGTKVVDLYNPIVVTIKIRVFILRDCAITRNQLLFQFLHNSFEHFFNILKNLGEV